MAKILPLQIAMLSAVLDTHSSTLQNLINEKDYNSFEEFMENVFAEKPNVAYGTILYNTSVELTAARTVLHATGFDIYEMPKEHPRVQAYIQAIRNVWIRYKGE